MVAIGYTSKGNRLEFTITYDGVLLCFNEDLVSLEIPEGVEKIFCWGNKLTELKLPKGIEHVYCENNLIRELVIPKSVNFLHCDRNVKGLDKIDCYLRLM